MSDFREVSRKAPCPVCGKEDWCGRSRGGVVRCMRISEAPPGWRVVKRCDDGGVAFRQAGEVTPSDGPTHWASDAQRYSEALKPEKLQELADHLGVRPDALKGIGVGWCEAKHCWTFPERDGHGIIIGITRRYQDGSKKAFYKSRRGIIIPDGLADMPDPVLVVEGASDVGACLTLGLAAVGRYNAKGAKHLDKLLNGRDLIVMGENDRKADNDWPGRDGAIAVAKCLQRSLGKPVRWALPPGGAKDIRSWLQEQNLDLNDNEGLRAAGRELLAAFEQAAQPLAVPEQKLRGDCEAPRQSQATRLRELVADAEAELFHDANSEAWATLPTGDHLETHRVRSKGFHMWCQGLFYKLEGKAIGSQGLQDALGTVAAECIFEGPEREVYVRLAERDGRVYLDLADSQWRAVEVSRDGWRVVSDPPVRFSRPRGMKALPAPARDGTLAELRKYINLGSDDDFILVVSWLATALRPTGPFPILGCSGEQGTAKSTACRVFRALIDPNVAPLRSPPADVRDLMIAANNAWCVAFDNVSSVPQWLSDSLGRVATGGGFATRELYSDCDETVIDAQRPIVLNGIPRLGESGDLNGRMISIVFPRIEDDQRLPERVFWHRFNQAQPRLFGALLDAVVAGLRNIDSVHLDSPPRMADFAEWVVACESALPWEPGRFLDVYASNRAGAHEHVLEASVVAPVLRSWLGVVGGSWIGTASSLLERLTEHAGDKVSDRKGWPTHANVLSGMLRRLAPDLRAVGLAIDFDLRDARTKNRVIELRVAGGAGPPHGGNTRATGAPPENPVLDAENRVGGAGGAGGADSPALSCHESFKAKLASAGPETAMLTEVGMEEFEL